MPAYINAGRLLTQIFTRRRPSSRLNCTLPPPSSFVCVVLKRFSMYIKEIRVKKMYCFVKGGLHNDSSYATSRSVSFRSLPVFAVHGTCPFLKSERYEK